MTESNKADLIPNDEERTNLVTKSDAPETADINQESTPRFGFLFFGVVGLLCYNFFLQVIGHLAGRTRPSFLSAGVMIYGISNNVGQLLSIFVAPDFAVFTRVWASCLLIALSAFAFPAIVHFHGSFGFASALAITSMLGLGNALFQSTGFGLAGVAGSISMNYMSFGQSVAGLLTWPLLLILETFYARAGMRSSKVDGQPSAVESASVVTGFVAVGVVTLLFIPYYAWILRCNATVSAAVNVISRVDNKPGSDKTPIHTILGQTLPLALTVWGLLFVTFLVFPAVMLTWQPTRTYPGGADSYYSLLIYVFQVFDCVGKYLAIAGLELSPLQLKYFSPVRILLALAFFGAQASLWIFGSDIFRVILVAAFATSNGLLMTWCMIHGPRQVRESEAEVAGSTMSFFLVNGIFFGSLTSLLISTCQRARPEIDRDMAQMAALVGSRDPLASTSL